MQLRRSLRCEVIFSSRKMLDNRGRNPVNEMGETAECPRYKNKLFALVHCLDTPLGNGGPLEAVLVRVCFTNLAAIHCRRSEVSLYSARDDERELDVRMLYGKRLVKRER